MTATDPKRPLMACIADALFGTYLGKIFTMFWRRFQLNWRYAFGELAIVTIGVLIALAINQWNSDRLDRADEFEIVSRLISDIEADLHSYAFRFQQIDEKEESLLRVQSSLAGDGPEDNIQFLTDIIVGANYGWNQGSAKRATFDDLLESGRLSVIANPDIRMLIVSYYEAYETEHVRIDERETAYPHLSYQIVPRGQTSAHAVGVSEKQLESGLSDDYLSERIEAARAMSIQNHVIAEVNLARFIRSVTSDLNARAENLVDQLKKYQEEID
jgi:hypothetical protein